MAIDTRIQRAVDDLNYFSPQTRRAALQSLSPDETRLSLDGMGPAPATPAVNLHCHTFFSYNAKGLSPTGVAWLARSLGWKAAGIVDFDVLDGVDEFMDAAAHLHMPAVAGIESRVFIPELADVEINSPGEPGIAYHIGVGFVSSHASDSKFLGQLKASAQARNRDIVSRVNAYLSPLAIDYSAHVLPLAPAGNPTERHLCDAYAAQARATFPRDADRAQFWADKLGVSPDTFDALETRPGEFQNLLRKKLMKRGGPGYVQPDSNAFPRLDAFNRFIAAEGAIPTVAWLDGCSQGEADADTLLDLHAKYGALALNIIPDRNWNIADSVEKRTKLANLKAIVDAARRRSFPIVVGTEMNAPGQRDVDDFAAAELQPYLDTFLDGAKTVCAHSALQRHAGLGYVSPWAVRNFPEMRARCEFYRGIGTALFDGAGAECLRALPKDPSPKDIVIALGNG